MGGGEGKAGTLEDRTRIQNHLDTLEKWSKIYGMTFHKEKCKVLYLGQNSHMHKYKME